MDPIFAISSFVSHNFTPISSDLSSRFEASRRFAMQDPPFATASIRSGAHAFEVALSTDHVARTLAGTFVYTVSNSNDIFKEATRLWGCDSLAGLDFTIETEPFVDDGDNGV